eukprot:m.99100 g.99100  ORF g.99100 m.99100 type:complete len:407 (+) comp9027_c0_seq2:1101-2321(+)
MVIVTELLLPLLLPLFFLLLLVSSFIFFFFLLLLIIITIFIVVLFFLSPSSYSFIVHRIRSFCNHPIALSFVSFVTSKMPKSKTITSFFAAKRKPEEEKHVSEEDGENPMKKASQSPESPQTSQLSQASQSSSTTISTTTSSQSQSSPQMSPEQKKIVEKKKIEAAMKLSLKKGVPSIGTIPSDWAKVLKGEFEKEYFKTLMKFLEGEHGRNKVIYPPADEVFSWCRASSPSDVKVVIIGQDPYIRPNQAHGLCFSVKKGVTPPPSLKNIYKELVTDIKGFDAPNHGNLMSWADQGVLLLNAVLTVEAGKSGSHAGKGWEKFTDFVIEYLNKRKSNVVFILWGNYAKKKGKAIDKKKHYVLSGTHPSPLSARNFFGCKHFSKTNEYLKTVGKPEINWNSVCGKVLS